jgi:hypothetical protein
MAQLQKYSRTFSVLHLCWRPYIAAHDTSTDRNIRSRIPAAPSALAECGAAAVREPRARRRRNVRDAQTEQGSCLAHEPRAASAAPDKARHSVQGNSRTAGPLAGSRRAAPNTDAHADHQHRHTHEVILGLEPGIFLDACRETERCLVRPEHGTVATCTNLEADPWVRVPRAGEDPVLRAAQTHSHGSTLTRADYTPAFAGGVVVGVVRLKSA